MYKGSSLAKEAGTPWIIGTLALSLFLASLGTSIANIALPAMIKAFAVPFQSVQWVVIAYLAALTVLVVFAGRLGDVFGLKRVHLAGLGLFLLSALLCGIAPDLTSLIASRILQGASAAFLMTLSIALARQTTNDDRLGRTMGMLGTVSALGTAAGPSIGGLLVSVAGWHSVFLVQGPLAAVALLLAAISLPSDGERTTQSRIGLHTVLEMRLAPNLVMNLLVAAVMMTTLVVGPFFLNLGLKLDDAQAGLVMSAGPLISIMTGIPSGQAVDKFGKRAVLMTGLTLLTAGAFLLSALPEYWGVKGYILAIIVLTPGYQLFQSANNTTVMADVPSDKRGLTSGLLALSRNIGLVLGASAMGEIFALGTGTGEISLATSTAIANGMRLTFAVAGVLMLFALLTGLSRKPKRSK